VSASTARRPTEEGGIVNQVQQLALPPPRTYTRTDFTALRAFVQRIDAGVIARRYYDPDTTPHAATSETQLFQKCLNAIREMSGFKLSRMLAAR
jgi:hypothetical protein